jgi:hypothetical protein
MRIGMTSGRGFGGTVRYDLDMDGRNDKETEILHAEGVDVILGLDGRLHGDPDRIAQSFRIQADMNPRVQQCVKHMYISYLPQDIVAMVNNTVFEKDAVHCVQDAIEKFGQEKVNSIVNEAMVNDWQTVLSKLGYKDSQYLIVRHSEKNNPHSHCILNMVDNNGNRLKDHKDIKRGIEICRDLTIRNGYTWGNHKSISTCKSERPRERERQSMCKDIYKLTKGGTDAWDLKHEAAKLGITVRYRTDLTTGQIKGVSFERNGIRFQGGKLDRSLSASKILPLDSQAALSYKQRERLMTPEVIKLLKAGGVAPDVNDHNILQPIPPPAPEYRMAKDKSWEYFLKLSEQRKLEIQERKERILEQRLEQQQGVRQSRGIKM